jgi:penicillin amidase
MQGVKFALSSGALLALLLALNLKIESIPPLGKLLNPFTGVWQNAEIRAMERAASLRLEALRGPVDVAFDRRGVPHIFADDDHDLYFTQGYLTARDRLWQMEFQTRGAAGRLAEVLGRKALDFDRFQRRIGMVYGARNTLEEMRRSPRTWAAVLAYSAGVNAYIKTLGPADYPLEYKLLDYAPEAWTPLKCVLLIKYMAWNLSGYSSDLALSKIVADYGQPTLDVLFPALPQGAAPVIPADTQWDFTPVERVAPLKPYTPRLNLQGGLAPTHGGEIGSNNWAVAAHKTAAGFPLLANDPHLRLSLPSTWYEIQLHAPGINTYGVSLPGAPGVVIGFNEEIAWGLTNGGTDVLDWYEIHFKDEALAQYRYDGQWQSVRREIEQIRVRGEPAFMDTVLYTHHGPVVWHDSRSSLKAKAPLHGTVPPRLAMRWAGHEPSDEIGSLYLLNRARDYEEFTAAIARFICPAQNFVFADRKGDIALWHQGRFPAKWSGQGLVVGDGADPLYEWQGWIPPQQNPHSKNPSRGFVASANQHPTALSYPYPWSWRYAYYRGKRINQRLNAMEEITLADFIALQLDNKYLLAQEVLPVLLEHLVGEVLDVEQRQAVAALASWDCMYNADMLEPTLFDAWWRAIYGGVWQDEFGAAGEYPTSPRTVQLIKEEPASVWFDDQRTEEIEDSARLIRRAFTAAWDILRMERGPWGSAWQWGQVKGTKLRHLLGLPGLDSETLFVGGGPRIVNATGRYGGPSWRMVVELGPQVRAWGIYPGGQSGNPGSRRYDDFIDTWVRGELDELVFLRRLDEVDGRIEARWVLEGEQ